MTQPNTHSPDWGGLHWSQWMALDSPIDGFKAHISTEPGLYRIRCSQVAGLVYVGQTGRNLRERTRALATGVYRHEEDPPWNDPHTAAPLLWAYRIEDAFNYEVSVTVAHLDKPIRQCLEDALLHRHRVSHGVSTLANHGRLHPLWTRPSNKAKGKAAHRQSVPTPYPSLPVVTGSEPPTDQNWLSLHWSEFMPLDNIGRVGLRSSDSSGVYRIRKNGDLVYLGQSHALNNRLRSHAVDSRFVGCEISTHEMLDVSAHNLLEREVDLIGSYYLQTKKPPKWQYVPKA